MGSCGDHYCDMRSDVRIWANQEHDRLLSDPEWVRRYPDRVARDEALATFLRQEVIKHFGPSVG